MSSDRKTSRETSDDRRGDVSTSSSSSSSHRSHPRGLGVEETTESADRSSARASTEEQTSAKGMKTVEKTSEPRVEDNTAVAEESSYDDDGEGSRDETRKSPSASSTASWNRKRGDEARKTEEMEETKTSEGKEDVARGEISPERVIDDDDGDERKREGTTAAVEAMTTPRTTAAMTTAMTTTRTRTTRAGTMLSLIHI